jgi:RNA polymerase sigma-70 factor (ECF subfamily)
MPDDRELLIRWREGDRAAGEQLYDRHSPAVLRFFLRLVYDTSEVQGLVHETFIACRNARTPFDGTSEVARAYILGVAYNKFREFLRRQRRGNRLIDAHVDAHEVAEVTVEDLQVADPSDFVERDQERRLLLKALRKIPVDYHLLFILSFWENLTNPQIGRILGLSVGTVASRLRLGKEHILRRLQEFREHPEMVDTTRSTFIQWWDGMEALAAAKAAEESDPKPPNG